MVQITTLASTENNKQIVENTFFCQESKTDHLVLILPGLNYSCDMPLLYYATKLMVAAGTDVVQVKYDYSQTKRDGSAKTLTEMFSDLEGDVIKIARVALQQRHYKKLTVIAKSLGTLAIPYLLKDDFPIQPTTCVFLTPILNELMAVNNQASTCPRSLFVIGTADRYFDAELLNQFISPAADNFMIIDGVNHSLEYPGDTLGSLQVLDDVVRRLETFLAA